MKKLFSSPAFYITFFLTVIFANTAFSQDKIIMRNNDIIQAKVEEIAPDVIKYRRSDNPDGPIYDVAKNDVSMILFANGIQQIITPQQNSAADNYTGAPQNSNAETPAPVRVAPPEMPTYEQPICPSEGYLWTPGYWSFGLAGYFWVPGVWVRPPQAGYLWTPGYWGYEGGYYGWHHGYWGEHIGFYGGVNYGYGYGGSGYYGGRWEGGAFRYNTAVSRVDVTVVHTTYVDRTVVNNTVVNNHASFNGEGGIKAQPTPAEHTIMKENHVPATSEQQAHVVTASSDKSQYASVNNGKPTVAAMNKPGGQAFSTGGHTATLQPNTAKSLPPSPHATNIPAQAVQPGHSQTQEPANSAGHTQTSQPVSNSPVHSQTVPQSNQPGQQQQHSNQPVQTNEMHNGQKTNQVGQQTNQNQQKAGQKGNNMQNKGASKPAPKAAPAPAKNEEHHK